MDGHSLEDIIAAATRAAEKSMKAIRDAAERTMFESNGFGRLGSSVHLQAEEEIITEGYVTLCEAACKRVSSLAAKPASEYLPQLTNLLRQYWTPLANLFLEYAVPGDQQGFVRNEANLIANRLDRSFEQTMKEALEEFRMGFPSPDAPMVREGRVVADVAPGLPSFITGLCSRCGPSGTGLRTHSA